MLLSSSKSPFAARFKPCKFSFVVGMLVCVCVCVCVRVPVCVCMCSRVYVLRIVSMDKTLPFYKYLVIVYYYTTAAEQCL